MLKKQHVSANLIVVLLSVCGAGFAQTPAPEKIAFEVASIKPSPPPEPGKGRTFGWNGGPGTDDPGMFRCSNCNLPMMLTLAYDVKGFQLTYPKWMDSERFEISAKVPAGATKAQLALMMQDLLTERFKLTLHRETKEMKVFDLTVAKGGPKFPQHVDQPAEDASQDAPAPARGRGNAIAGKIPSAGYDKSQRIVLSR